MKIRKLVSDFPTGFLNQLSWQYVATLSVVIFGFVHTIMIAGKLGAASLGVIALGASVTTIIAQFFNLNMKSAIIRYVTIFLSKGKPDTAIAILTSCILINLIAATLFFLLVFAAAPFLNDLLIRSTEGVSVIRIYSIVLISEMFLSDSILGYIRIRHALSVFAIGQLISSVLRLAVTYIGLFHFQMGLMFVVITTASTSFLTFSILLAALSRLLPLKKFLVKTAPWRDPDVNAMIPEMKTFVRNNYLTGLLTIPGKELDINLLGFFTTVENIGVYKIAKNFISSIWAITDPIHLVIYPECAKFWANNDRAGLLYFIKKVSGFLLVFSLFVIVGSSPAVSYVVQLFMGDEFSKAGTLFIIMVSSIVIWIPLLWAYPIFLTAGRTDLALKASLAHSILSALLYVFFIARFGVIGAAIAYAVNAGLIACLQYYLISRNSILQLTSTRNASIKG
ncbi:MAG: hypothetical protein GXP16_06975 [Gammaproteobacteria bacterium]|nr:hypothetical protein [Gammaproteobacteria bacterium]